MGGGARDFQAVLEGVLGSAAAMPTPARRSCVAGTPDPGLLLSLFGWGSPALMPRGSDELRARGVDELPALGSSPPASVTPRRILTLAQHAALDHLRTAGATDLDATFTLDSLKQAFRQLALRYHPDRHPGCTERDRRRLAATFAGVHDAYRTLLGGPRVH
jgi:hypothetical protein